MGPTRSQSGTQVVIPEFPNDYHPYPGSHLVTVGPMKCRRSVRRSDSSQGGARGWGGGVYRPREAGAMLHCVFGAQGLRLVAVRGVNFGAPRATAGLLTLSEGDDLFPNG